MNPSEYTIIYRANSDIPFQFFFLVRRGNHSVCRAFVRLDDATSDALSRATGPADALKVRRAVAIWAIRKLEALLREGDVRGALDKDEWTLGLQIQDSDVPSIGELASEKSCDYQITRGRDLFCSAADKRADETIVAEEGPRALAPTSRHLCSSCELPDTDFVCSHLLFPKIVGSILLEGTPNPTVPVFRRRLVGSFCDIDEKCVGTGSNCHPGGNPCWVRAVKPEFVSTVESYQPALLSQALDHLDAVWRLKFGRANRLVRLYSAVEAGALEADCSTRDEFSARLSNLDDILKAMVLSNDLVKDESIRESETLKRLTACLRPILDADQMDQVHAAIGTLAAVNELRVAAQHSLTRANPAAAYNRLGIPYPPTSWKNTWNQVRSRVAQAVNAISSELNKHT
jgi:hypothetical protein